MRNVTVLSLMVLAAVAGPANGRQTDGDLAALQADRRDELARARRLRADADAAQAELPRIEARLNALGDDVAEGDAALVRQRERLTQLNRQEAELTADMAREQAASGRLLSALQMLSRRPPPPLLIPRDKAIDTVRAAILIRAMTPDLQHRARALTDRQTRLVRIRRDALLSSEGLLTAESDQGDRRAELESLRARKTALAGVLNAEAAEAERAASALDARIRALGGRPAEISDDAPVRTAALPAGRSRLTAPVEGAPSRRFGPGSAGWRWSAIGPVRAPAAGRVAYVGTLAGWGEVVILDLGPGWRAIIAGLDTTAVQQGQSVADGADLGQASGEAYFELRRDEQPVDPAPWLR